MLEVIVKNVLVASSILFALVIVLSACGPNEKNTESTISVTPGVPTVTPITSVMPSEKPSPIVHPTATPKVSLPINESIMSKSKRQELISLLYQTGGNFNICLTKQGMARLSGNKS
jgi:hypothetical protein